jgi:hypothetical protein
MRGLGAAPYPGYFPGPGPAVPAQALEFPGPGTGQIGIPRFPEIPAQTGWGDPEYFPESGQIGIGGEIPNI